MITADKIPQEWKDLLCKIQVVFPSAVIAGGCLRDLDHDKPFKDVDIFVPIYNTTDNTHAYLHDMLTDIFPTTQKDYDDLFLSPAPFTLLVQNDYDRCNLRDEVLAVYKVYDQSFDVDVIFVESDGKDPVFCTFDMSINQIQFCGRVVSCSGEYIDTKENKIITIINQDSDERRERRIVKLQEKYGEYTIDRN